jgi:hypothetical protein
MKVLFTGMASSHCHPRENVSFFGTLAEAVGEFAEVTWATPKISWTKSDLEKFDFIFLGFIPPTAMSANKIYGAMHVLGLMFDSPKLRLVADSQQIWQYKNSINHIKKDVSRLFDRFYSKRAEYKRAKDSLKYTKIEVAAEKLDSSVWPITYYPALPWTESAVAARSLGFSLEKRLVGLNLDSMLINPEPIDMSEKAPFWSVVPSDGKWLKKVDPFIFRPLIQTVVHDETSLKTIKDSLGLLVPPQDRNLGTWWNYRYIQALNSNTPIVTDWTTIRDFDPSWSYLAYQIEEMSPLERLSVAKNQLESYRSSIKTKNQSIDSLREAILDLSLERI